MIATHTEDLNPEGLVEKIEQLTDKGWKLHGSPFIRKGKIIQFYIRDKPKEKKEESK